MPIGGNGARRSATTLRRPGSARAIGDVHLQGLCLLNNSEVHLARQAFELARESAEAALAIFDQLGSRMDKSDAYACSGWSIGRRADQRWPRPD